MEEVEEDEEGWGTTVEVPRWAETAYEDKDNDDEEEEEEEEALEAPQTAAETLTELTVEAFPVPHDEDDEAAFDADADSADDAKDVIISSFS